MRYSQPYQNNLRSSDFTVLSRNGDVQYTRECKFVGCSVKLDPIRYCKSVISKFREGVIYVVNDEFFNLLSLNYSIGISEKKIVNVEGLKASLKCYAKTGLIGTTFFLTFPYLETMCKIVWYFTLKPIWLYLSWTYDRFVGLFESIDNKLNPPETLSSSVKKPFNDIYGRIMLVRKLIENRLEKIKTIIRAVKYSGLILFAIGLIYYLGMSAYRVGKNSISFMIDLLKSLYGL